MILAKFSKPKAYLYLAGMFALCIGAFALTLFHPNDMAWKAYLESKGPYRFQIVLIVWAAMGLFLIRLLAILNRLMFHGGKAIWAVGERLYFINLYRDILFTSIQKQKVASVNVGSVGSGRPLGLVIEMNDQREKKIATWILSEPAEVILQRLRVWMST